MRSRSEVRRSMRKYLHEYPAPTMVISAAQCHLTRLPSGFVDQGNILAVPIGRMFPAILVVVGHALRGERFHLLERAVALRLLQLEHADQFVAAGIIHFV